MVSLIHLNCILSWYLQHIQLLSPELIFCNLFWNGKWWLTRYRYDLKNKTNKLKYEIIFFPVFVHWNDLNVFVNTYHKWTISFIELSIYHYIKYDSTAFSKRRHGLPAKWDLVGNLITHLDTTARGNSDRVEPHKFFALRYESNRWLCEP